MGESYYKLANHLAIRHCPYPLILSLNHLHMIFTAATLNKLHSCKTKPATQPAVGRTLHHYWKRLHLESTERPPSIELDKQFTRTEVKAICQSQEIEVLDAYAVAMAWGGQHLTHFKNSVSATSKAELTKLLTKLRHSTRPRAEDFDLCSQACDNINGLGISFFTKLLYFFRANDDAFILDQWTAKSAHVLLESSPILITSQGMPHVSTNGEHYELFCQFIEKLAQQLSSTDQTWTADETEIALFDKPRGEWRSFVRSSTTSKRKRKSTAKKKEHDISIPKVGSALRIEKEHNRQLDKGIELPDEATLGASVTTVRISSRRRDGVCWQYSVNQNKIHAEIHFESKAVHLYDDFMRQYPDGELDCGNGIVGNTRDKSTKTRKLRFSVEWDSLTPLDDLAESAVANMNYMFQRLGERF